MEMLLNEILKNTKYNDSLFSEEARQFIENAIISTIICSQREPASWSSMILNDEVSANAILKRATKHYTVVIKPRMAD